MARHTSCGNVTCALMALFNAALFFSQCSEVAAQESWLKRNSESFSSIEECNKHVNALGDKYNALVEEHNELMKKYSGLLTQVQDPSTATFLSAKAYKVAQAAQHPGILGAANKTAAHVLPAAQKALAHGDQWISNNTAHVHQWLDEHGNKVIPKGWLPSVSGFVVYGSVLIPALVACWCLKEMMCHVKTLLLYGHIYLAVSGGCATAFALATGDDPLRTFALHDYELYQFAQVSFAMLTICYLNVSIIALNCILSDMYLRTFQLFTVCVFSTAYYFLVWTPSMMDEHPKIHDLINGLVPTLVRHEGQYHIIPAILVAIPYFTVFLTFSIVCWGEFRDTLDDFLGCILPSPGQRGRKRS